MKGSAFIKVSGEADNQYVDIYETYGVSFLKDTYFNLITGLKQKEYVKNNSRVQNGTQYLVNSTTSKVAESQTTVTVLLEASSISDYVTKLESFSSKLRSGVIFLKIPSWLRVLKLVCTAIQPKQRYKNNSATFTLTFVEPNPTDRIVLTT